MRNHRVSLLVFPVALRHADFQLLDVPVANTCQHILQTGSVMDGFPAGGGKCLFVENRFREQWVGQCLGKGVDGDHTQDE